MSWGLEKKLSDIWQQLTARFFPTQQSSDSPNHAQPPPSPGWRPFSLRPVYLSIIGFIMQLMLLTLEGLRQYTVRYGGLVFFQDTTDLSQPQAFFYNYFPIIVALILVTLWSFIDFDVLRLEPYFQISRPEGVPATTLFINYNFGQSFLTPITSAKRGHWIVLSMSLVSVLIRMFLPALQSTLLELKEISIVDDETIKTWPDLVDLQTQAQWISVQENNLSDSPLSSDSNLVRMSRFSDYAVAPVEIPLDDFRESTVWTLNQTVYWSELSCQDIMVQNKLSVAANDSTAPVPTVSWNMTGVSLEQFDKTGQQCTLDFQYSNIFFSDTDFLQIRYWEPASSTNTSRAISTTGCSPFDLYGVLIAVNATRADDQDVDDMSLSGVKLSSSATMFGCKIDYRKAEAAISMHANSSITAIVVQWDTATEFTGDQFNINEFQNLLSHRAPYTSDMLFFDFNKTTGGTTVTELPVIKQQMGDLEPLMVLDTSTFMTQDQFEYKVTRGVQQSFLFTVDRLFNSEESPLIVPATRLTQQVTLAVVNFAAICSEIILGLCAALALLLIYVYHNRDNILQSDPSSIGAMCSIVTELLSPTTILAHPDHEFHQFSTRQLRQILRDCQLRWQPGPGATGRHLEVVTSDGSPLNLGEQTRTRVDPMPHFLIIPIFIIEFLLLAAVITTMAVIIAFLDRKGSFRHLSQSDSSFLQVVLSFLPAIVSSAVGSLCTSIHRHLSVLEPWVHLQRGSAAAQASLSMNYASQTPWAVLIKTVRNRHVLLGTVSLACIASTVLTVVAGGLFTQQMTTSTLSTSEVLTSYSNSVFQQTDFAADFTEYDLIQTSITSGVPTLPWMSANQSFVPLMIENANTDAIYGAGTLGIGAYLECQQLSIADSLIENTQTGTRYWVYSLFNNNSRQCTVNMTSGRHKNQDVSLFIHFLSPMPYEQMDECQTSTVLVVGRWNYNTDDPVTDQNTIALHCEPRVLIDSYYITFDTKGLIQDNRLLPNTTVTSDVMYENATVSLGQFNKVFAAVPQTFVGISNEPNGSSIASYDWAGFMVSRLYKKRKPDFTSLDANDLMEMSQTVYQWVYSTYFSLWRDIYLYPLQTPYTAHNASVTYNTWAMVFSVPCLAIALVIITVDTLVVLVVFGTRRGRFTASRMPRSIGAVIPWIAHSRMLSDFRGTYFWPGAQLRDHIEKLNKRYAFRMFLSPDGRWRYAVDEEPEDDKAVSEDGTFDEFKMSGAIQLHALEDRIATLALESESELESILELTQDAVQETAQDANQATNRETIRGE